MGKIILPFLKYVFALATTTSAIALLFFLQGFLSPSTVALIFLIPVLVCTTFWGLGPGLMAGGTAFLALNYFFTPPYYTFDVLHTQDLIGLAIFFLIALLTSQLIGRARKNLELAQIREVETQRLYELSFQLMGVNDPPEIASVLARQTQETFLSSFVRVSFILVSEVKPFSEFYPPSQASPTTPPDAVISISDASRDLGELHLWRERPLDASERRVLQTFATQTALAWDRALLLQAETRAQVLEESDRMKTALLSSVSHEFRTPLATIKASITSLLSGRVRWDDAAARDELMDVVDEESDQLNRLVGNLLDMSRLEAGALKPERHWNVLAEIIEAAVGRLRRELTQHRLMLDLPDDLPLVPVDYFQLERVFTNLISNSIKYAPAKTEIEIQGRVQSEAIWVSLTNQGPPVAEEDLPRIFDKFHRVTDSTRVMGTGLGLSICKGIIEAHSGHIWAENLPGKFAIRFTLPLVWQGHEPREMETEIL